MTHYYSVPGEGNGNSGEERRLCIASPEGAERESSEKGEQRGGGHSGQSPEQDVEHQHTGEERGEEQGCSPQRVGQEFHESEKAPKQRPGAGVSNEAGLLPDHHLQHIGREAGGQWAGKKMIASGGRNLSGGK